MLKQSFFTAVCLVHTWLHPRFNIQILFLKAQVLAMKACLQRQGTQYAVLEPKEKEELLRLGEMLGHDVKDIFLVNSIDTYRKWRRRKENGGEQKKPGRLRTVTQEAIGHILRFARENPDWGYSRITGELKKISIKISHITVKTILIQRGILPPPEKGKRKGGPDGTWRKFIAGHMATTVSMDYFTSKLTTLRGVVLAYSLVFIHHATRRVWISQPTLSPGEDWNIMQLKGAVWWFEDQGIDIEYMIRDRDKKYSEKFDWFIKELTGNNEALIKTAIRAPNMNAYVESMIGHMKSECHDHFWFFTSLAQLGRVNAEYMFYHNHFRPHQGKENGILTPPGQQAQAPPLGDVMRLSLLGGILNHYYREAG